jgi:hypothetical protein
MKKRPSPYFEITDGSDIVRVSIDGYTTKPSEARTGSQWLESVVTVKGCTLGGQYSAEFMPIEIHRFRQQLVSLIYGLEKIATFENESEFLHLQFEIIYEDFAEIEVRACDVPGVGSVLNFKMGMAISDINSLMLQLENILNWYPIDEA